MMTLRYGVVGLGQDGATAPGQQVVRVLVGHLQLAGATRVTAAAVSVSFDGGKTWQPARVTGGNGSYAAVFTAPPGARVTLRTRASDTGRRVGHRDDHQRLPGRRLSRRAQPHSAALILVRQDQGIRPPETPSAALVPNPDSLIRDRRVELRGFEPLTPSMRTPGCEVVRGH
jgi:hypothetical protein